MTTLANLLDPQVLAKMKQVAAAQPAAPAPEVPICPHGAGVQNFTRLPAGNKVLFVHAECMLPTARAAQAFPDAYREALSDYMGVDLTPATVAALDEAEPARVLTAADAIDIDPESEALIEAKCADCHEPVLIDPALPEGVDPETPRVPLCTGCGRARAKEAARQQRNVETIRRTRVAKHQPRMTDGIDHPVEVKHTTTAQEGTMQIDLNNLSDADLGRIVRERMLAERAEALPAKREEAVKAAKGKKKAAKKAKQAEQARRKGAQPLPEFAVGTSLVVPALDLSEVEDLNETVSAVMRAPYNKARFRLLGEPPLPCPKSCEEDASLEPTTYAVLAREHVRLTAVAAEKAKAKAEEAAKPKAKKVKATVAVLDEDEIARKVKALRSVRPDLKKKDARALVLSVMGR